MLDKANPICCSVIFSSFNFSRFFRFIHLHYVFNWILVVQVTVMITETTFVQNVASMSFMDQLNFAENWLSDIYVKQQY